MTRPPAILQLNPAEVKHSTFRPNKGKGLREVEKPRKKTISKKLKLACDLLAAGEFRTVTALSAHLGLSREHLSRSLNETHVQAYFAQKARAKLVSALPRAAVVKVDLLNDALSEHVRNAIATEILAMGGIAAPKEQPQTTVNVGVSVGYVIDLRPDGDAPKQIEGDAVDVT